MWIGTAVYGPEQMPELWSSSVAPILLMLKGAEEQTGDWSRMDSELFCWRLKISELSRVMGPIANGLERVMEFLFSPLQAMILCTISMLPIHLYWTIALLRF